MLSPAVLQLVLSKIRDRFGGNLRYSFVGGASTPTQLLEFFEDLDIKIVEGYGLTETSPMVSANTPDQVSTGRRGTLVPDGVLPLCVQGCFSSPVPVASIRPHKCDDALSFDQRSTNQGGAPPGHDGAVALDCVCLQFLYIMPSSV